MGRAIKRVPIGFDWPLYCIWWGYQLDPILCQSCQGTGKAKPNITKCFQITKDSWYMWQSEFCPICGGEGKAYPKVETPKGPGYQLWSTTSEGCPISPVFATAEELAVWLFQNPYMPFINHWMPYDHWLHYILANG